MSSTTRVLHTATWKNFAEILPERFGLSLKVVKEAIMADINDLVQEFWRTSSDGVVGASIFAMRRLFVILERCFDDLEVCIDIIPVFVTAIDLADKNLQPNPFFSPQLDQLDDQIKAKFKILFDGYRKMLDQSCLKSKDLGDVLRFLPGVVMQGPISMQGMADLYRIKPDLLERLIKSTIEPLGPPHVSPDSRYTFDGYLSCFLRDRDRSRLYYCDPILQCISICRHFLSLLDGSSSFDFQS